MFDFEHTREADRVLQEGEWVYKQKSPLLDRWNPEVGCFRKGVQAKSAWVRLVGLPLFLCDRVSFKQVGDACGGFLGVDEETAGWKNLQ